MTSFRSGSIASPESQLTANDLHYSMVLEWDVEDRIYVVTVPELPGCQTHGRTYDEAVRQGQDAIASWVEAVVESGQPIPPPRTWSPSVTS
jgi:antitoxin HicB